MDAAFLFAQDSPMGGGAYDVTQLKRDRLALGAKAAKVSADVVTDGVGHNLRLARERARITQEDAAEAAGIGKRTLIRIEKGEKAVTLGEVVALCVLYGTHLERALGIIDAEREHLLDTYDASSPTNRRHIIELAEMVQSGTWPAAEQAKQDDWVMNLARIIGDPDAPKEVKEEARSMWNEAQKRTNDGES